MNFKRTLVRLLQIIFIFSGCFSPTILAGSLKSNDIKRSLGEKFPVLILGAGMAGITAAETLHAKKIDFRVLEGTGRIGGRLFKKDFNGGVIEYGANWVHGKEFNPIWQLVQSANLKCYQTMIKPTKGKYIVLDKNGEDVTEQDGHIEFERAEECLKEITKERPDDISVRQGLSECQWIPRHPAQTSIEYYYYDFDAAAPPEEISCGVKLRSEDDFKGTIDSTGGRQVLVSDRRGYASIITNMAKPFEQKVLLNHEVKKIERKKDFVEVMVKTGSSLKTIIADYVLVTFSIGVLRKQVEMKNVFNPPLPLPFQRSLLKMHMANYLKIFLKFSERFWPQEFDYIFYASEERGFYPVWQNLPGTATGIPENDKILLVTVTGKKAWELKENKQQIQNELLPVLKNVFKRISSLIGIELKNWGEDTYFLGAYSNPEVGTRSQDFNTLLRPVDGRLYFAGEGLSELYFGFAHGAYLTGQHQAMQILNRRVSIAQYQHNIDRMATMQNNATLGLSYVLRKNFGKPGNKTVS